MGVADTLNDLIIGLREMIDVVLILVVLLLLVVILKIIEKGYRIKLELGRKDRNRFYRKEINRISDSKIPPEKMLDRINIIARGFFKEAFNFPYSLEYLELAEEFRKKGIREGVSFCRLISELNYSGEEISKSKTGAAMNLLGEIVKDNHILTEEEKLLIEKRKKLKELKKGEKTSEKQDSNKEPTKQVEGKIVPVSSKRKDINHISPKYRLKIALLRLRGRIPEIRKVNLKGK